MTQKAIEYFILDATETITLRELAECCGMSPAALDELVDYTALVPLPDAAPARAVQPGADALGVAAQLALVDAPGQRLFQQSWRGQGRQQLGVDKRFHQ